MPKFSTNFGTKKLNFQVNVEMVSQKLKKFNEKKNPFQSHLPINHLTIYHQKTI